ncbi:MAG: ABC transporter permease [Firmicutes bacterium]|nr:ABC transporter permease [Bacillota bacterium]
MEKYIYYVLNNWDKILFRSSEHVFLAFTAVALACLVGIPIGLLINRNKQLANFVMNGANILQTVPSLAMFALLIPLVGIRDKNAILALFLYGLLPIIKNTYTGIRNVDPAITEAAKGMGMSSFQMLYKVQTPLAVPVIMAGVRIATVTGIGVATIATLIGSGGLGALIYQGISVMNYPMMISGALAAALLALLTDYILGLLERLMTSKGITTK